MFIERLYKINLTFVIMLIFGEKTFCVILTILKTREQQPNIKIVQWNAKTYYYCMFDNSCLHDGDRLKGAKVL